MRPIVFGLPGDDVFTDGLVRALRSERATLDLHRFPDGELKLTLPTVLPERVVVRSKAGSSPLRRLAECR